MKRPINICSGQFGDLTLEELCKTMHEIGYNGIEIATQAHLDVRRVLTDAAYRDQIDETLNKYDMHIGAISAHLIGQCVGDNWEPRLDNFAPAHCKGNPEAIRAWAIEEMKNVAYAAKLLNVKVVSWALPSGRCGIPSRRPRLKWWRPVSRRSRSCGRPSLISMMNAV